MEITSFVNYFNKFDHLLVDFFIGENRKILEKFFLESNQARKAVITGDANIFIEFGNDKISISDIINVDMQKMRLCTTFLLTTKRKEYIFIFYL